MEPGRAPRSPRYLWLALGISAAATVAARAGTYSAPPAAAVSPILARAREAALADRATLRDDVCTEHTTWDVYDHHGTRIFERVHIYRVFRRDGDFRRRLVRATEQGSMPADIRMALKSGEPAEPGPKGERLSARKSPFLDQFHGRYRFDVQPPARHGDGPVVHITPLQASPGLIRGTAELDPASYAIRTLDFSPAKLPRFAKEVHGRLISRPVSGHWLPSNISYDVNAQFLFLKRRIHKSTTYTDYVINSGIPDSIFHPPTAEAASSK